MKAIGVEPNLPFQVKKVKRQLVCVDRSSPQSLKKSSDQQKAKLLFFWLVLTWNGKKSAQTTPTTLTWFVSTWFLWSSKSDWIGFATPGVKTPQRSRSVFCVYDAWKRMYHCHLGKRTQKRGLKLDCSGMERWSYLRCPGCSPGGTWSRSPWCPLQSSVARRGPPPRCRGRSSHRLEEGQTPASEQTHSVCNHARVFLGSASPGSSWYFSQYLAFKLVRRILSTGSGGGADRVAIVSHDLNWMREAFKWWQAESQVKAEFQFKKKMKQNHSDWPMHSTVGKMLAS